jgi:hypothetical protein
LLRFLLVVKQTAAMLRKIQLRCFLVVNARGFAGWGTPPWGGW